MLLKEVEVGETRQGHSRKEKYIRANKLFIYITNKIILGFLNPQELVKIIHAYVVKMAEGKRKHAARACFTLKSSEQRCVCGFYLLCGKFTLIIELSRCNV